MGESSGQVEGPQPKPSRFQFVPVPGEFTRGRWKCRDSYHPYAETLEFEKNKTKEESNPDKISVCFKLRQPKDELESSSTIQVTSVESNVQDIVEESSTSESIIITRKNGVTIVRKTSATDAADNYDKIRELSIDDFEQKTTKPPQVPPTPMNTPPATMVTDPSIGESLTPPIVTKSKTFQVHSVADSTISQPTRKTSLDVEAIQKNAEALLSETAPHSATVPAQKPHVFQVEPVLEASLPKPTPLPESTSTSEPTFQVIQTEESKNMSMDSVKNVIDAQTEQRNVDEVETPTNNVTITVSAALEKKEIFQPIREASGSVSSIEACGIPITSPPTAPHSTPYGTPKDTQRSPTFDEAFSANVPVAIAASVSTSATETLPIDNKIEQAMELVKTHLTYAVREEVDTLRNTITELEYQMREYQFECNFYRQNATPEVADQAAAFVRQQMTKFQQPTRRAASTTSVILDGAQQSSVNASNSSPHMRNLQNQIQQIKQIAPHAKPVSTTTTTATTTMTMSSNSNEQPAPSVPAPTNPPAAQ